MWNDIDDADSCRKYCKDSTRNRNEINEIDEIMEQHEKSSNDILALLKGFVEGFENAEALSVYKNFISDFFVQVQARLGTEVWVNVKVAINRKYRHKEQNFRQVDEKYISKLQSFLQGINMTVKDIELMMLLMKKNNVKFRQEERLGPEEAREKFETSFPEDLKDFKDSMKKVLGFLDDYDQD